MRLNKRHIRRGVIGLLLAPILLVILLMGALYVPFVQDLAVQYASREASKSLGMQVGIERLRLTFPLNLVVDGVSIVQTPPDTLLSLGQLSLGIKPIPLLSRQVYVESLEGKELKVHYTDSLGLSLVTTQLSAIEGHDLFVDLKGQFVDLGLLGLKGGRVLYHSVDTLTKDEPESEPLKWRIHADALQVEDTRIEVDMPLDSIVLDSYVGSLDLDDAQIDLEAIRIELGRGRLSGSSLSYAIDHNEPMTSYLDYGHIRARDIALEIEQVVSEGSLLNMNILEGRMHERSGLNLETLQGAVAMDSTQIEIKDLAMRTEHSALYGQLRLPWSIFSLDTTAMSYVQADGAIGAEDVRSLTGQRLLAIDEISNYDASLRKAQLTEPIDFSIHTNGTLMDLDVSQCQIVWGNVLDISAQGRLYNILDAQKRRGKLKIEGGLQGKAQSLMALISPDLARDYSLPSGMTLKGTVDMGRGNHRVDLWVQQGNGRAKISGTFVEQTKRYKADVAIQSLDLRRFMPKGDFGLLSADLDVLGRGFNPMQRNSYSDIKLRLHQLEHKGQSLEQITLDGSLKGGELVVALNSFNQGLNFALQADALLGRKPIYSSIMLDAQELDFKAWGLSETPLDAKFRLTGEVRSNLEDEHSLTSVVEDLRLSLGDRVLKPKEVRLEATTSKHRAQASLHSGDLNLSFAAEAGLDRLMADATKLGDKLTKALNDITKTKAIPTKLESIMDLMPPMTLEANMGGDNALKDYLAEQRIALGSMSARLRTSRDSGLVGFLRVQDLRQDTMRINAIDLDIQTLRTPREPKLIPARRFGAKDRLEPQPDSLTLALVGRVYKRPYRTQEGFDIRARLNTTLERANLDLDWLDDSKRSRHKGNVLLGWNETHYYAHLLTSGLRIGYQDLRLSPRNYIALNKSTNFLRSDLKISGDDRMLISLQASDSIDNTQDIHLMVEHLRLEDFKGLGLSSLGGTLFGDIRYSRVGDINQEPIITGDISAQELRYEDKKFGHFATALFYQPRNNSSHYITADVSYQGASALSIDGIYHPNDEKGPLSGTLSLTDFPLQMLNPFLATYSTSLKGALSGSLELDGKLSSPTIEGALTARDGAVTLGQLATEIKLDTIPLRLKNSTLFLDRYALTSAVDAEHPLLIDGNVVLFGKDATRTNLHITADEMVLLNQPKPKTDQQLVYGRLIASSDMRITGPADALKVRGRLSVLGGTNCTYIMREDPLDVTDKMGDLLTFVDFSDTLFVKQPVEVTNLGGLDVNMSLSFDPSVRFGVDLTADGRDYMRVQGGGNMQFSYPPYGEMRLIGRYEMSGGGKLSYTMPIVGSKQFNIDPSGYLLFNGDIMNPYINFIATQTVKASTGEGKNAQKTNFLVSIKAQDHINNIKLGFDLAAPENLSIQNSLSAMTAEERGKQAIGLLGTGIYLAGNKSGAKFNIDDALSSLLQSQITKAAGTLLQGTDLDIGMEVHDGTNNYTDYTYSFSRRFYNDRIRIVVGGKIQSGNVPSNKEQTLIDNVALEYQLDKAGEQHLRLFHKRITDDILEGEYTETGTGYVIKRKLNSPWDLFRKFRLRKPKLLSPDTVEQGVSSSTLFTLPVDTTTTKH